MSMALNRNILVFKIVKPCPSNIPHVDNDQKVGGTMGSPVPTLVLCSALVLTSDLHSKISKQITYLTMRDKYVDIHRVQ